MNRMKLTDCPVFSDNESYLEWIKNSLYPDGIRCARCHKITKHSKVSGKHCYVCNKCGHKVSPTAGTIFYRSATPLKTWFDIARQISENRGFLTAREVQQEYGVTYKTAWRIVHKVREYLKENKTGTINLRQEPKSTSQKVGLDTKRMKEIERLPFNNLNSSADQRNLRQRHDRTARLLRMQMLLCQYPGGLRITEISDKLAISKRTIYRDLRTLESELKVPIWEQGSKRGINEGYFLPPVNFTLEEATNIFFAARLMQNFYPRYAPGVALTFFKLNSVAPSFLKKQIGNLLEHMEKQPKNEKIVKNWETLMSAWYSHHKIRILCQNSMDDDNPVFHIVEPYFVEPSVIGNAIYIVGYSNLTRSINSFRFDRIVGDIKIEPEIFTPPENLDVIDCFEEAWGIHFDSDIKLVKLRFKPKVAYFALNLYLHPSQQIAMERDGSVVITLKVRDAVNFRNWVMEWGDLVEVLEPEIIRNLIGKTAQRIADQYRNPK